MKTYQFKQLLQNNGWLENAQISIDDNGIITEISSGQKASAYVKEINGFAIPGFQNAHSHAFQYAMAGLAEKNTTFDVQDDFWGWREAMYQLALQINPEQLQAIATMLYAEMIRHGYTNVTEFHYLHHDKNGKPYENVAELGSRLIAAAKTAGIGITLVPIFYQMGGFGKQPTERQRRFLSPSIDDYLALYEASSDACKHYKFANVGVGIHSMRAVKPDTIIEIANSGPHNVPFHIHVSEQLKEIEDSLNYLGKRPVAWLLENIELNHRFNLVHATHMTNDETVQLAQTKANVVLCPSTEGNLGDGIFPLRKYQDHGGNWSIGTDSHIGLNPLEELRILDYGQRLTTHKRNTFKSADQGDSGKFAIDMTTKSGRIAMGNHSKDFFKVGDYFNACIFDASAPLLSATSAENLASTLVYATDVSMQLGTFSQGIFHLNDDHQRKKTIQDNFKTSLLEIKNR